MTEPDEEEEKSRRQVARRAIRDAGVSSSRLANLLMQLPPSSLPKLGLEEGLLAEVERARRVTAMVARRRAERSLAGALRRVDLDDLATRIENVRTTGVGDPRRLHQTERWRTRLLDEEGAPEAFRAAFPEADHDPLSRLINDARRERTGGKPPGAARALFRHISTLLEDDAVAKAAAAEASESAEDSAG